MKDHVFELYKKSQKVDDAFGPFEYLDDDTIVDVPANLIWSMAEFDDGIHFINGQSQSSAVMSFFQSSTPWEGKAFEIDVFLTVYLDCEDCDGDPECKFCDEESNMIQIGFERFTEATSPSKRNANSLWESRLAFGTTYEN
jgi:hypothetical protein